MLYRKYRKGERCVTQYEFYKYPIQNCRYPIHFYFKGKYPIPQKNLSVSLILFQIDSDSFLP